LPVGERTLRRRIAELAGAEADSESSALRLIRTKKPLAEERAGDRREVLEANLAFYPKNIGHVLTRISLIFFENWIGDNPGLSVAELFDTYFG
jgi:hypothetical protein